MKYAPIAGDVIGAFCLKSNYVEMKYILGEAKSMGSRGASKYLFTFHKICRISNRSPERT